MNTSITLIPPNRLSIGSRTPDMTLQCSDGDILVCSKHVIRHTNYFLRLLSGPATMSDMASSRGSLHAELNDITQKIGIIAFKLIFDIPISMTVINPDDYVSIGNFIDTMELTKHTPSELMAGLHKHAYVDNYLLLNKCCSYNWAGTLMTILIDEIVNSFTFSTYALDKLANMIIIIDTYDMKISNDSYFKILASIKRITGENVFTGIHYLSTLGSEFIDSIIISMISDMRHRITAGYTRAYLGEDVPDIDEMPPWIKMVIINTCHTK
jgi:hypothetical protein